MQWRILVADDSQDVSTVVDAVLRRDGRFEIYHARNGEEALALARSYLPHIIILDIMMPRVHGLKVCKTLKSEADTSSIRIIMLSALGREYTKREAVQNGADAFVTKPFSPRDLVNSIEIVLRGEAPPQATPQPQRGNVFMFNRGDEVRILAGPGEAELVAIVKTRIPPEQVGDADWGYRVALETGGEAFVRWDQVIPARSLDRAV
jgi:DNA-binding response OmpR family regulator